MNLLRRNLFPTESFFDETWQPRYLLDSEDFIFHESAYEHFQREVSLTEQKN